MSMEKKIRDAMRKKLRETENEQKFIFEGIDHYSEKSLGKFFEENDREDYIWEESLAESLYNESDEIKGNRAVQYEVGDIIMTSRYMSRGQYVENSPHKILVVTSKKKQDDTIVYQGFLFSSKVEKSNKRGSKYPNNIYIKDYSSILYKGVPSNKEAFIRVDDLITFTNKDLDVAGSWKGKASWDFLNFVQKCVNNYRVGLDNSEMYWEK